MYDPTKRGKFSTAEIEERIRRQNALTVLYCIGILGAVALMAWMMLRWL